MNNIGVSKRYISVFQVAPSTDSSKCKLAIVDIQHYVPNFTDFVNLNDIPIHRGVIDV